MDTMEITKIVGAACGSLLAFLLLQAATVAIFDTHAEEVAYLVEVPEEGAPAEEGPAEEVDVEALVAEADAGSGEGLFRRCSSCHKLDGTNGVGPHLDGVVGREIGGVDGFGYSDALAGMDGDWTAENIFHFIENPKGFAPGTAMNFAGLPKPEDRADLIAYLESLGG